ncbi:hypothetical protein S58_07440 [Bradyrhizobium oligotrophicum S58]|uniref:Uncharacterized protein n=1 Tax=Bradyrhizobium oligotrophicum S58 TaxID=1245469 RepID=M4Z1X2_9BRAD|nr:hypothetical protein [Bradyrhizobium oligotrophicum]BAM86757.1 hypothetical protein S58_07440 [Bradyrhizobium oligotrophicum S58]
MIVAIVTASAVEMAAKRVVSRVRTALNRHKRRESFAAGVGMSAVLSVETLLRVGAMTISCG